MNNTNISTTEQNNFIIGDAALGQVLGISVVTINRLKAANKLPYIKCGHKYRYILADVLNSMKNNDYDKLTAAN